ncbi:response regulator [Bifidobacterium leontopitheci]|nr:response regulator transcription factor [Bifidobacterium leontopitheci]
MTEQLEFAEYCGNSTVAIVDNDKNSSQFIVNSIHEHIPLCSVLWTDTDGRNAIDLCLDKSTAPDLLLLDMSLEGVQGPSVCRRIRRRDGTVKILAISSFSLNSYRQVIRDAGAQGIVSKNNIRLMLETMICLLVKSPALEGFESAMTAHVRISHEPNGSRLTVREEELLDYVAATGASNEDVSARFGISVETVRKHLNHIIHKLHVTNLLQAVISWRNTRHE